jgi:hypothetical protein
MTDDSYIAQLLASVFFMWVGVRLLLLHRRTREAPEKLLGIYFLITGVSYLGWLLPLIFHLEVAMEEISELAAWALYSIGVVAFLLFTRLVFRPNTAWTYGIVAVCALGLSLGVGSWIIEGRVSYALDSSVLWFNWMGYTIPCIWLSVEAFLAHSRASRRARIGLCDHVVANRYLLFGCFGLFQTFACITDVVLEMDYASSAVVSGGFDLALGIFEMAGIAMLFLVFFPPAFYQRWIAAPAAQDTWTLEG